MTIGSNNMNAMLNSENKINDLNNKMNSTIASSVNQLNGVEQPKPNQDLSTDFVNSIVEQIPEVIAYEANAQGIKTKDAVMDTLLDIKA